MYEIQQVKFIIYLNEDERNKVSFKNIIFIYWFIEKYFFLLILYARNASNFDIFEI